jgi:hypothetical protein
VGIRLQPGITLASQRHRVGDHRRNAIEPPEPITAEHVDEAKDRLILARATHLDSLAARLNELRVRKFIKPLIVGGEVTADPSYDDDLSYARDLGLIRQSAPLAIANPIYKKVIVRILGARQGLHHHRAAQLPAPGRKARSLEGS